MSSAIAGSCQRTSSTDNIAQVVDDRLLIVTSSGEANIAVRADQDQRVTGDTIGAGGVPIVIDQRVVGVLDHVIRACNRVGTQRSVVGSRQWWYGLVAEDQQREMRATEEIAKSDLFGAFSTYTERIWSTISSADARRVIQVARKSAPSIGQAQLSDIGEGFFACEKCLEGLIHIVLESPMADGTGSQDALGDREPFGLIGVQQGVRCIIFQDLSQLPAKV